MACLLASIQVFQLEVLAPLENIFQQKKKKDFFPANKQ